MTETEIDLSHVVYPRDIHVAFSTALRFPDWYGHNWDAFWDLISSHCPLPDRLRIRGLDHIERVLPAEAAKMLTCLADYNNAPDRVCAVTVTDDYATPLHFLQYEARPTSTTDADDAKGAFVNCWIKAKSSREANEIAIRFIRDEGWEVVRHEEVGSVSLATASDDDRPFVARACVDGAAFDFHTWSSDEE